MCNCQGRPAPPAGSRGPRGAKSWLEAPDGEMRALGRVLLWLQLWGKWGAQAEGPLDPEGQGSPRGGRPGSTGARGARSRDRTLRGRRAPSRSLRLRAGVGRLRSVPQFPVPRAPPTLPHRTRPVRVCGAGPQGSGALNAAAAALPRPPVPRGPCGTQPPFRALLAAPCRPRTLPLGGDLRFRIHLRPRLSLSLPARVLCSSAWQKWGGATRRSRRASWRRRVCSAMQELVRGRGRGHRGRGDPFCTQLRDVSRPPRLSGGGRPPQGLGHRGADPDAAGAGTTQSPPPQR